MPMIEDSAAAGARSFRSGERLRICTDHSHVLSDDWQIVDDEHSDNDEWVSVSDEDEAEYVDACADLEGVAMLEDGMGSQPAVEGDSNVVSAEPMCIDGGDYGCVESAPSSAAGSPDDQVKVI